MPSDFIKINVSDTNATKAADLRNFVQTLTDAYSRGKRILGAMNHNFVSGPPVDFTALEALYGLPAGKGQTIFNLVNGSLGAMEGTFQNNNTIELIERVG